MKYALKVLFSPACWVQLHPYSKEVDDFFIANMDKPFYHLSGSGCRVSLADKADIWVANHPYASFTIGLLGFNSQFERRPSRRTILKLGDKFLAELPSLLKAQE